MRSCPLCNSRSVGKIGANQFYCWNCLVEYNSENQIFEVQEDGSFIQIENAN